MLLDLDALVQKYRLKIDGVVHVGAHTAEEAPIYKKLGINEVWWVEANPDNKKLLDVALSPYDGHHLIMALVTDEDHEQRHFNVTNYQSMSSSVFEFGTHQQFSPDIFFTHSYELESRTLDSLNAEYDFSGCNMLNMDIQGAELLALRGATELLKQIDVAMLEVNNVEVYLGCAKVWELDDLLRPYGLERIETTWVGDNGWGDAAYLRSFR